MFVFYNGGATVSLMGYNIFATVFMCLRPWASGLLCLCARFWPWGVFYGGLVGGAVLVTYLKLMDLNLRTRDVSLTNR